MHKATRLIKSMIPAIYGTDTTATELSVIESIFKLNQQQAPAEMVEDMRSTLIDEMTY